MPSVTRRSEYVRAGLLASYGPSLAQLFYRAGGYAARILKGQSVADLPIDQAEEFELVVNEKTATMLGLRIPDTVRFRATVVQ
jgi:putative ABC transport system substrate-binding protein